MSASKAFTALAAVWACTACETAHQKAAGAENSDYRPLILDANEGRNVAFPLHQTKALAGPEASLAGMSFFELQVPSNTAGAPPHTHTHEDEFFYVREGQLTFMADGARKTISAGGFALLTRNGLHAFWNDTDHDAIVLIGTSEGEFDDFFDAVALEAQKTQAASPEELGAILAQVGEARGIVIDMTKLPEDVAALYGAP
ncbi:MAG: cupin domain-containing protein [Pseudomonadota bacterium]